MPELVENRHQIAADGVGRLLDAQADYQASVSESYDEVVMEVSARGSEFGSFGKLDIAALTGWKRLRADTTWMAELMSKPDSEVRHCSAEVIDVVNDTALAVAEAAGRARSVLTPLPGFGSGGALASAVCFVAAPARMAVYDKRAHRAVRVLGFDLDYRRGRYRRYMAIVDACRVALRDAGHDWDARRVDTALYQLGGRGVRT